ncbi:MAG: hypothetical protein GY703_24950 [Gammaproteobacteria bacterium]|nr:hypothetical protein [Gammaproteobacteria bacterium]
MLDPRSGSVHHNHPPGYGEPRVKHERVNNPQGYGKNSPYFDHYPTPSVQDQRATGNSSFGREGAATDRKNSSFYPDGDRGRIVQLPKNLTFDGSKSWKTFAHNFKLFLDQYEVTDLKTQVFHFTSALSGQAADYFARVSQRRTLYDIRQAYDIMEERFDDKELSEAALFQFSSLTQTEGEDIKEWADRVWFLAIRAYPDLEPHQVERNVIQRFTLGLRDREALRHIAGKHCDSMSAALNAYKVYDYTRLAAGESQSKTVRFTGVDQCILDEDPLAVNKVSKGTPQGAFSGNKLDCLLKLQEEQTKQMSLLCSKLDALSESVSNLARDAVSPRRSNGFDRGRSPSPRRPSRPISPASRQEITCFKCNKKGHFKWECPDLDSNVRVVLSHDSSEGPKDPGLG